MPTFLTDGSKVKGKGPSHPLFPPSAIPVHTVIMGGIRYSLKSPDNLAITYSNEIVQIHACFHSQTNNIRKSFLVVNRIVVTEAVNLRSLASLNLPQLDQRLYAIIEKFAGRTIVRTDFSVSGNSFIVPVLDMKGSVLSVRIPNSVEAILTVCDHTYGHE